MNVKLELKKYRVSLVVVPAPNGEEEWREVEAAGPYSAIAKANRLFDGYMGKFKTRPLAYFRVDGAHPGLLSSFRVKIEDANDPQGAM